MTITIAGTVPIKDDMYLGGVTEAKQLAYTEDRTVEGLPTLVSTRTPGGRNLTLETTQLGGSIQGIWCQNVIDALKVLEDANNVVTLDHHGTIYNVVIVDTTQFEQMFSFEPVSPTKAYTGKLVMKEV